jgi:hypothetical protein
MSICISLPFANHPLAALTQPPPVFIPYVINGIITSSLRVLSLVTILSGCEINNFAGQSAKSVCYNLVAMFDLFRLWLGAVLRGLRTRRSLMLENLALRQQLAVFKRQ